MYFINHTSGWIIIAPVIIPSPITHIKNSQIEPYEENKEYPLLCSALWCQITGPEDALVISFSNSTLPLSARITLHFFSSQALLEPCNCRDLLLNEDWKLFSSFTSPLPPIVPALQALSRGFLKAQTEHCWVAWYYSNPCMCFRWRCGRAKCSKLFATSQLFLLEKHDYITMELELCLIFYTTPTRTFL